MEEAIRKIKAYFEAAGWELDDTFPPGFFYPNKKGQPHLHLTCEIQGNNIVVGFLHYKIANNKTHEIYVRAFGQHPSPWLQAVANNIADDDIRKQVGVAKIYKDILDLRAG